MKKTSLLLIALFMMLAVMPCEAGNRRGQPSAPRVLAPGDETNLTGKDELEFRWSAEGDRSAIQYYDFRLYKGSQTIESGLLRAEKVPSGTASIKIKADVFEDGQIYAWSIRAVGRQKSRSNYTVFKIIKQI